MIGRLGLAACFAMRAQRRSWSRAAHLALGDPGTDPDGARRLAQRLISSGAPRPRPIRGPAEVNHGSDRRPWIGYAAVSTTS